MTPTPVASDLRFKAVDAGAMHTCALTLDGVAYCWGYGQFGQVCEGTLPYPMAPCTVDRPVRIPGDVRFRQIDAGTMFTCAASLDWAVYCWGANHHCGLGFCGTDGSPIPTRIPIPGRVREVAAGNSFGCALTTENRAFCWGGNRSGQLGSLAADTPCSNGERCAVVPVEVSGGHRWRSLSASESNVCGVTLNDEAFCWGSRAYSHLAGRVTNDVCVDADGNARGKPCAPRPVLMPKRPR